MNLDETYSMNASFSHSTMSAVNLNKLKTNFALCYHRPDSKNPVLLGMLLPYLAKFTF